MKGVIMKLDEILCKMNELDEELISLSQEEIEELAGEFHGKIDSICAVKENFESRIEHHKKLAAEHSAKKRSLENALAGLENFVTHTMKRHGMSKAVGNTHEIKLAHNKRVIVQIEDSAINDDIFAQYSDAINVKFAWNKSYIKENIDKFAEIAKIETSDNLRFGVRK